MADLLKIIFLYELTSKFNKTKDFCKLSGGSVQNSILNDYITNNEIYKTFTGIDSSIFSISSTCLFIMAFQCIIEIISD